MDLSKPNDSHDDPLAKRCMKALVQCYVKARLANKQYYGKIQGPISKLRWTHFQEANRQLYEVMEADTYFKQQVELLYPGITKEVQPGRRGAFSRTAPTSEVTWHHEPNRSGIMQLVPTDQHRAKCSIQSILHPERKGGMEN